jgi:hypothetical protein
LTRLQAGQRALNRWLRVLAYFGLEQPAPSPLRARRGWQWPQLDPDELWATSDYAGAYYVIQSRGRTRIVDNWGFD